MGFFLVHSVWGEDCVCTSFMFEFVQIYMCICGYVWRVSVHMKATEAGSSRSPRAEVPGGCEALKRLLGTKLGPLQEQQSS